MMPKCNHRCFLLRRRGLGIGWFGRGLVFSAEYPAEKPLFLAWLSGDIAVWIAVVVLFRLGTELLRLRQWLLRLRGLAVYRRGQDFGRFANAEDFLEEIAGIYVGM